MLNTLNQTTTKTANFGEIPGLEAGKKYLAHDMWTGKELGVYKSEDKGARYSRLADHGNKWYVQERCSREVREMYPKSKPYFGVIPCPSR
jgi:hypothetical protein